jgi:hypothetical protein
MHFPLKSTAKVACITGESSPYYLYHPKVAKRIARVLPKVKLIAMLRNPVDRAISHYYHEVKKHRETLSFERAIEIEEERISGEFRKLLNDEFYHSPIYQWYSYKKRGIYIDQIIEYEKYFSRDQILILKSEEFFEYTTEVLQQIFRFLEVDAIFKVKDISPKNVGNYGKVDKKLHERLKSYFEPHNRRLYEHLNRDFGW